MEEAKGGVGERRRRIKPREGEEGGEGLEREGKSREKGEGRKVEG